MSEPELPSLEEYSQKLVEEAGPNPIFTNVATYNAYMNGVIAEVKQKAYAELVRAMTTFNDDYVSPDFLFLTDPSETTLTFKSRDSILNKIYRKNVLHPKEWTKLPDEKRITLIDCHKKIDDLVRTKFICRYLDGPKYVCERLAKFCEERNTKYSFRDVTTPIGYHAWHFYYRQPLEDFAGLGGSDIWVELQFTTQLAEVIGSLTHTHYERTRMGEKAEKGWRWDVSSDLFRPYYIAHGLHLLEGVILEYRDAVLKANEQEQEQASDG